VITVFPQLAFIVGGLQRVSSDAKPVVAWCFNMGSLYAGLKRVAATAAFAKIDRFVVHSRAEISQYARWLRLPEDRFRFVHLQRAPIPIEESEDQRRPFVLAMGSARRDYACLIAAVRGSGYPTVVVAAPHALAGLSIPDNVEVRSGLSVTECHRLAQRARVNVVPILNEETASGQVTLLEAMRMGRAIVATRCAGSQDYVENEVTGLLVEPGSPEELRRAIERLWIDSELRERVGRTAANFAAEHCSDEAAGLALGRILDEVEAHREGRHSPEQR
jgi:glycosyltransferase involved in cell wall biosynthesis